MVGPWDAALRETRPEAAPPMPAALKEIWMEPFGDRRTELVVIGQDMDKAAVEAALRAAELTDAELDQYKQRAATALAKMQGKSGRAAQSDAETVSAHSAIASFAGVSNWASGGVAKFYIDRYLKYAHIADAPELEVLGDTFELPLALSAAIARVVEAFDDLDCVRGIHDAYVLQVCERRVVPVRKSSWRRLDGRRDNLIYAQGRDHSTKRAFQRRSRHQTGVRL